MNFNKYIGAFKNAKSILEGVKNNIFKKEHVEAEAALRYAVCKQCSLLDKDGNFCLVPGTQPCCGDCGCSLGLKTRSLSSSCPLDKWPALMTEEEEEALNKKLGDGGNI
jgi:hypothetical protein